MDKHVFVVTGANKGVGFGIVESLAQTIEDAVILLTARDEAKGEAAVKQLSSSGEHKSQIIFHQLDVTDDASIQSFADYLRRNFGAIDVLINNAGINYKKKHSNDALKQAKDMIDVNYYGTKKVTEQLISLIREGGRVVNVCSACGILNEHHAGINVDLLVNAKDEADIDRFVEDYKKSCKGCTEKSECLSDSAYEVSRAAEIALSVMQQRKYSDRGITVNSADPGAEGRGRRQSIEEAAETPVYLATAPHIPAGKFVSHCQVLD